MPASDLAGPLDEVEVVERGEVPLKGGKAASAAIRAEESAPAEIRRDATETWGA